MMSRFQDKVALITGGASGIGLATAQRLAAEGARLVIVARSPQAIDQAVALVRQAGAPDVLGSACDVTDESAVVATVQATLSHFGRLDVIVNSAGQMQFTPLEQLTDDDWHRLLWVDLIGAFHLIKQGFLRMQPGGTIVNVSSIHAIKTEPLVAPYAAAKAAVLSLTRSAAIEGKPKGLRINAVLPGAIDTTMLWDNPNVQAGVEKINPAEVGKPADVAAAIAYLASDEAAFVQGTALIVDGGRLDAL